MEHPFEGSDITDIIENVYYEIVAVLTSCAECFVPKRKKTLYKFWWDEELNVLKEASSNVMFNNFSEREYSVTTT